MEKTATARKILVAKKQGLFPQPIKGEEKALMIFSKLNLSLGQRFG